MKAFQGFWGVNDFKIWVFMNDSPLGLGFQLTVVHGIEYNRSFLFLSHYPKMSPIYPLYKVSILVSIIERRSCKISYIPYRSYMLRVMGAGCMAQ